MKIKIIYFISIVIATINISLSLHAQVTGQLTDNRDGITYKWVKIGNQVWMAENLNYNTPSSRCYDNNSSNCSKYGRLYTWEAAMKACPPGWHLPSDAEWTILTTSLGGESVAGGKMKARSGWFDNGNGTNSSGFTALPGGYRYSGGNFCYLVEDAAFWSSTEYTYSTDAWDRSLYYNDDDMGRVNNNKANGFSVRCLRNKNNSSDSRQRQNHPTNRETENNSSQKFLDKFNDADSDANRYYRTKFSDKWAKRNEANNVRNKFAQLLEDYEYLPTSFKNSEQGIKIKKRIKARISNMTYEYQNTY